MRIPQFSRVLFVIVAAILPPFSLAQSSSPQTVGGNATLVVKVVDPQRALVSSARLALYIAGQGAALAVSSTGADGTARFESLLRNVSYRLQVFAPGFSEQNLPLEITQAQQSVTVALAVAAPSTTVVVSADRTPLPAADAGALASWLDSAQLDALRPVSAIQALRFMPGAMVNVAGRRGGQASLFVRGGDSRYNKVIVDGVVVNDPGGTFDFGVVPMEQVDRMELVRGPASTLYGADAMTSVVELSSRNGSTRVPELRFGGAGGTFGTADGFLSLAGARGRFDYNLFGDEFHTQGQGTNDEYSNALQGGNIGVMLTPQAAFRFRARHSNSRSGVQSFWNFNGNPLLPPDSDQWARQNNFLASAELTLASPARWQHRLIGFESNHKRRNVDDLMDAGRVSPAFGNFDFPFHDFADINRAGLEYQGEYWMRSWARTTFGYRFEVENGFAGDELVLPVNHGLRRNHATYGQQVLTWNRFTVIGGARLEHNESFGNRIIPRLSISLLALRGGSMLSGTRLRFGYGTGIKAPRFEESFGIGGFGIIANPHLKPEKNRSFEAGVQQGLLAGRAWLSATYFNNLFQDQIAFSFDAATFTSQYVNLNQSFAHGAEVELRAQVRRNVSLSASYTYTSTQVLKAPLAFDPLLREGSPLLRRPKHAATLLLTYSGTRWGGSLAGTFVGRRPDSDFLGLLPPVTYAAGYGRLDLGLWPSSTSKMSPTANMTKPRDIPPSKPTIGRVCDSASGANNREGLQGRMQCPPLTLNTVSTHPSPGLQQGRWPRPLIAPTMKRRVLPQIGLWHASQILVEPEPED
jgi:vitamin B12 transporter